MKGFLIVFFMFVGIAALIAAIISLPIMLFWNWVIVAIFGIAKIGFFKALGIGLVCGILVGLWRK